MHSAALSGVIYEIPQNSRGNIYRASQPIYCESFDRRQRRNGTCKNTGRCRELLPEGAKVFLADEDGKERKTRYDLVAALKDNRVINMDSQAPNAVVKEALQQGLIWRDIKEIKP